MERRYLQRPVFRFLVSFRLLDDLVNQKMTKGNNKTHISKYLEYRKSKEDERFKEKENEKKNKIKVRIK